MSATWPVSVEGQWAGSTVRLRPLRARADRKEFLALRADNADWTRPWDSTSPHTPSQRLSFAQLVRQQDREGRDGLALPFAVEVNGALAGQMHLFSVVHGALMSGAAGYWISKRLAGQGITPFALAMLIDHAFGRCDLHRVEVNIRPDNPASLRVVDKLGLRDEGVRRAYLHINGTWHDHRTFAITVEDLQRESAVQRLERLTRE
ncbi:GNAT family N-acetyltransferase [Leekyejoonella antrihumi]|uniref:GNAT family N-acetyltransferase n=1 Tax=Leekyejoonella antrihumi TaxID=1660198 RepID=A0A563E7S9_9MICO|nr:GNAT family protein [Leekyejoonella antrihumi]TWP38638.1 GNAT family N-acetyltransferase [Leekyejoonella antrihumi]